MITGGDIKELGFLPDDVEGEADNGTWTFSVFNRTVSATSPRFLVKVVVVDNFVTRIIFPARVASIVPPDFLMSCLEQLGKSNIDPAQMRTIATSQFEGAQAAPFYSKLNLEEIVGPARDSKSLGGNHESLVIDLIIGREAPVPFACLARCRISPSSVEELDFLFAHYRIRAAKTGVDIIGVADDYKGGAKP